MIISEIINHSKKIEQSELNKLRSLVDGSSQVILIGNGGSNAIASHIAVDYIKFLIKKSFAFTDASMLTAYINDYGSDEAYRRYLSDMIDTNTLVILISSSGNSINIYNCAEYCKNNNINFVILTGFDIDNKIKTDFSNYSQLSYWVDSHSYGVVESLHQIFLHSIIDN